MVFIGNRHPQDPQGRVVAACNGKGVTFDGITACKGGFIASASKDGKVVAAVIKPTRDQAVFALSRIVGQ